MATEHTWPRPPSYYLSGGPWSPPRVPTVRKRHAFGLHLVPEATGAILYASDAPVSGAASTIESALGLPPDDADLKGSLMELFGSGGADIGHIAELFQTLLEDLAGCKQDYKKNVEKMRGEFDKVRGILEAYHPKLAIAEIIEALRTQTAEREAAIEMLTHTVASVKARVKEQAETLLAQKPSSC